MFGFFEYKMTRSSHQLKGVFVDAGPTEVDYQSFIVSFVVTGLLG